MPDDIGKLSTEEIYKLYPKILRELKKRGVIRSNNLVGEIGEYLAVSHYTENPKFPNLIRADVTTKNIDAISRDGERYSIKTVTGTSTGTFWGLQPPSSEKKDEKKFEYVVIVIFDKENLDVKNILEIDWDQFLEIKRWHSWMKAWNIPVNAKLMKMAKKVF
tara:strand:- start:49 stop:534 length:486 start_codon:yes stop_codon:yes gene_type:complete